MRKQFKDLTEEEIELIKSLYKEADEPSSKRTRASVQNELALMFRVTERSIRNWARELNVSSQSNVSPAKILLFDIETAPMEVRSFQKWGVNIGDNMIMKDWYMICWSAKWLFEDKVFSMCQTPAEARERDDKRITQGLWNMLDEADIVVAHNLNKFDKKRANTLFLKHGLSLPSPYHGIDTLLHARKTLAITSNRLDYIAKNFFGVEGKIRTETDLWNRAVDAEPKALKAMTEYCDQDVRVLEEVYLRLRPFIKPHPNVGLHISSDVQVCATCGGDNLDWGHEYHTTVNTYEAYQCNDCKSWGRSRKGALSVRERGHITVSTPIN